MSDERLEPARHEPSDVGGRFIWMGPLLLVLTVISVGLIVLRLYPGSTTDRELHLPLAPYPVPRLQPDPAADMARFYALEMHWLNSTGWIDKKKGVAHFPVAEAMRVIVERGIPGWAGQPETPSVAQSPETPAPLEKTHEATRPASESSASVHGTSVRNCRAGASRNCIRAETRRATPRKKHLSRRHRAHRATR